MPEANHGYRDKGFNRSWMLFLLMTIYVFNLMDRQVIAILAEPIRKDLLLADTQLGLLTGMIFAMFYGVCGVPIAWLADRFGRIRVIGSACVVWSICSAAGALASNFLQLAAARIGVAVGEAGGTAPSHALIADNFPVERRATALGLYNLAIPIGSFLGILLCGWIGENFGWRTAIAVVSLPGILIAAILFMTVAEPEKERPHVVTRSFWNAVLQFWQSPLLPNIVLAASAAQLAAMGLVAWLPSYLMRAKGMTLSDVGYYYGAANAIALGIGTYSGGYLSDRLSGPARRSYALLPGVSCALGAPFVLFAIFAQSWQTSLMLFMIPIGLTSMVLAPAAALVQHEALPFQRGVFASTYLLVSNMIGAGIGPLLVGTISDLSGDKVGGEGLGLGIATLSLFMLLATGLYFRLFRILPKRIIQT